MDRRRPSWLTWLLVALLLAVLAAVLFWEMAPTASQPRVARVLPERAPMDLNRAGWRTWALLLAALVLLAAALLLVGRQIEPFQRRVARALQ